MNALVNNEVIPKVTACSLIIILGVIMMFFIHKYCNNHNIYDFSNEDYILYKTLLNNN